MNEKKLDWHLFWTAAGVVIALGAIIIGCYSKLSSEISVVNAEIVKIQTVLIIKGIVPSDLFATECK